MKIGVYFGDSGIQELVAKTLHQGIIANGHKSTLLHDNKYTDTFDGIAFYGMSVPHIKALKEYRSQNKPVVVVDLGYFGHDRGAGGTGYLKVAVNHWHPTEYFQKFKHLSDRVSKFKLSIKPMSNTGSHILLVGIGPKSAVLYDIKHQEWDEHAVKEIRKHTDRKIVYRAKPSSAHTFKKLPGTEWSEPTLPLGKLIAEARTIVTHHSNVAVDGIINGKPCFVNDGVSSVMGLTDLSKIETPRSFTTQEQHQFLSDIAYTQWTYDEIASGKTWKHFETEGLI